MRRLFLQFYISVLIILICTGIIHFIVYNQRNSLTNFRKVEQALAGGIRVTAQILALTPPDQREDALDEIRDRLDYPADLVDQKTMPGHVLFRMGQGDDAIMYFENDESYICSPVEEGSENGVLVFGPLPQLVGPSQADISIGIFLVLSLMGLAIYLALRPISRQLRALERSILNFARGNLGTRAMEDPVSPLLELAQAFNIMATRTENMVRTQRELLQAVSHELRTPLSRINFGIDLARHADDSEEREVRFQAVEMASQELDELVGELLRYVRMESDAAELVFTEVPVTSTVKEVVEGQEIIHAEKEFELLLDEDEVYLIADATSFRRALSNLISNAGKYAKSHIRVEVVQDAEQVTISIEDDGPGIAEEDVLRAFEPFVRLTESGKGVGLGLAVVRRILEKHRAQIEIRRSELGGARVSVYWPLGGPTPNKPKQKLLTEAATSIASQA